MSIFNFIGEIFKPIADLVDNVHTSTEEKGQIKTKLAEIEAKVATQILTLQSEIIAANAKVAQSEQQYGNWLSKTWRPFCSICLMGVLVAMALDYAPYNQVLALMAGSFLGIYSGGRSYEKKR